jgi:AAA domain
MTYNFRKAAASEAKPLIGLYSESGCGKTHSALLLAKGFTGEMNKVLMIETEAGRGEAWANDAEVGGYNVYPLRESFSPSAYGAAISEAERAGMTALIIDSASHEWEGVGGVLDMASKNQEAGKKGPIVWQKPKIEHAREFMLRLTQTSIPLVIVCMRAKYPMEEAAIGGKKEWRRSEHLSPKQSEDILFEMFVHGWIDREHRFMGTKYTLESMRDILRDKEPISVATGQRLAAWAANAKQSNQSTKVKAPAPIASKEAPSFEYITADQAIYLADKCRENGIALDSLLKRQELPSLAMMPAAKYEGAKEWLDKAIEYRNTK